MPKRSSAIRVARAEAPILISVIPTSRVTRRSCGRVTSGSAAPGCFAKRRSRARPSEKYAASAPVSSAEHAISANSSVSCKNSESSTAEVLESRRHHGVAAVRIDPPHAATGVDLADGGERGAQAGVEARTQSFEGAALAREQQL